MDLDIKIIIKTYEGKILKKFRLLLIIILILVGVQSQLSLNLGPKRPTPLIFHIVGTMKLNKLVY